jgi:hypothetical protein
VLLHGAAIECTARDFLHRQVDRDLEHLVSQPENAENNTAITAFLRVDQHRARTGRHRDHTVFRYLAKALPVIWWLSDSG